MPKSKVTTGEARMMAAGDAMKKLEEFVNTYSHLKRPYYIAVVVKNKYQGPAPAKNFGTMEQVQTTEMELPDKMIHSRIIGPFFQRPPRQFGTFVWYINNQKGEARLVDSLPHDVPVLLEDSEGTVVEKVAKNAQGMPIIYS